MSLPLPNLDDRRFDDLVADARRLIMQRCPEWTDRGPADPGITLVEAVAFLTDQLLYRLNRVPDRLFVRFLDLIGVRLIPATAARATVTFWLATPARARLVIPIGTLVATQRTGAQAPLVFSTGAELEVTPCALSTLRTRSAGAGESVEQTQRLELGTPVPAFSAMPVPDDTLLLGVDAEVPSAAVRIDFEGRVEGIGVNPVHPPLVWEARCADGWVECAVGLDETGGLNHPGAIILHVPPGHRQSLIDGQLAGWLRARVVDPAEGQPPYHSSPLIEGLAASTVGGTVEVFHAEVIDGEAVGTSDGTPGQWFTLSRSPVLAGFGAPTLQTGSDRGWRDWIQVEHFADSAPTDRHFVLDALSGRVLFGPLVRQPDGTTKQYGAVPERGAVVRMLRYAVGGGSHGNVAAGEIRALRSSIPFVSAVQNRQPAQGGVDAESLEQAKVRGPILLRSRNRAVTAEDYEEITREAAPEVSRVRCVVAGEAGVHAGQVRVLVVPAAPDRRGHLRLEDLIPAEDTLARIAERLRQVGVLGVQVMVEPPLYRGVTAVARLVARPRTDAERLREDSLAVLYRLLSPLPGGGPHGHGWPFGRPVQVGEVFAALETVRGVDLVEDLRLFAANPVTGTRGPEVGRVDLEQHSLVFSFEHQVRIEGN
ncbi:putative baseplate assembly protein [Actinocatenispora thailandica]|uniref:Putative baseplate assembly protein n=1 Tax=Actinocatenispora thailandica TaxID=227318 RepID=A0A7R7DSX4_9ACTN|nr:putative baseplate assembly protein [Actinocatenispora thailandica]BCJ37197.1 putative baseplate assembly protein [Actinocatenispora thailandica]